MRSNAPAYRYAPIRRLTRNRDREAPAADGGLAPQPADPLGLTRQPHSQGLGR